MARDAIGGDYSMKQNHYKSNEGPVFKAQKTSQSVHFAFGVVVPRRKVFLSGGGGRISAEVPRHDEPHSVQRRVFLSDRGARPTRKKIKKDW